MRVCVYYVLAGIVISLLSACGGGDGGVVSRNSSGFTVDGGVAQKGALLKGSHVWIDELISGWRDS
jgi:hypothetical protein